ncbi:MAG: putative glycoside hydrolase [Clostridia bacterium]|nr:putative glycoside hydrolase [Clostridia bacterium]
MSRDPSKHKKRTKLAWKKHAIAYRQKLRLKKALRISLIVLGSLALCLVLYIAYASKYVRYGRDGAHIDFRSSNKDAAVQEASRSESQDPIEAEVVYESKTPAITEQGPFKGYYVTTKQLQHAEELYDAADALDHGSTVMLELKSIYGYYYYHTSISGTELAEFDIDAVETLISKLKSRGCNLIALIPAFPDNVFAEANFSCALPTAEGYLWLDENRSYWLNPADETVLSYLEQIAKELSSKGFSEVVFEDFTFPASASIHYNSSKSRQQVVADAAKRITTFFEGSNLIISFATDSMEFPTQDISGRLYIDGVDAAQLDRLIDNYSGGTLDAETQLVFITDSKDSRFDAYSTMQLLS